MIKTLMIIAGSAFVLMIVSFAAAIGLYMHDLPNYKGDWTISENAFKITKVDKSAKEEIITRTIDFDAVDVFKMQLPQDVVFQKGDKAQIVLKGPKSLVDSIRFENGILSSATDDTHRNYPIIHFKANGIEAKDTHDMSIVVTSPSYKKISLLGSGSAQLENLNQEALDVDVTGSGSVNVSGFIKMMSLSIIGSGDIYATDVMSEAVDVNIVGSGDAHIAPKKMAKITITGSGDVNLEGNPESVTSNITGSGSVNQ